MTIILPKICRDNRKSHCWRIWIMQLSLQIRTFFSYSSHTTLADLVFYIHVYVPYRIMKFILWVMELYHSLNMCYLSNLGKVSNSPSANFNFEVCSVHYAFTTHTWFLGDYICQQLNKHCKPLEPFVGKCLFCLPFQLS